jgi:hypothetical protein
MEKWFKVEPANDSPEAKELAIFVRDIKLTEEEREVILEAVMKELRDEIFFGVKK